MRNTFLDSSLIGDHCKAVSVSEEGVDKFRLFRGMFGGLDFVNLKLTPYKNSASTKRPLIK